MESTEPGSPIASLGREGLSLDLKLRIRSGDVFAMGPGKAALLQKVDECQSIAGAGRALGWSYWKTRHLIDEMNACFHSPVVVTTKGGNRRGGAELTAMGRLALDRFRVLEAQARKAVQSGFAAYVELLKDRPDPMPGGAPEA